MGMWRDEGVKWHTCCASKVGKEGCSESGNAITVQELEG